MADGVRKQGLSGRDAKGKRTHIERADEFLHSIPTQLRVGIRLSKPCEVFSSLKLCRSPALDDCVLIQAALAGGCMLMLPPLLGLGTHRLVLAHPASR